jgi:hypothetical protein
MTNDPMLLRAAQATVAQQQAQAAINGRIEATAANIYAQLAAIEYHNAEVEAHKEADPYGTAEGPVEVRIGIDPASLARAARFSRFAAVTMLVAWGVLPEAALAQFQPKE